MARSASDPSKVETNSAKKTDGLLGLDSKSDTHVLDQDKNQTLQNDSKPALVSLKDAAHASGSQPVLNSKFSIKNDELHVAASQGQLSAQETPTLPKTLSQKIEPGSALAAIQAAVGTKSNASLSNVAAVKDSTNELKMEKQKSQTFVAGCEPSKMAHHALSHSKSDLHGLKKAGSKASLKDIKPLSRTNSNAEMRKSQQALGGSKLALNETKGSQKSLHTSLPLLYSQQLSKSKTELAGPSGIEI